MIVPVIETSRAVTLVGGGEVTATDLAVVLELAPVCVAADGGADRLLADGIVPEAVIGDFDSISSDTVAQIPVLRQHRIREQSSTDFEKALLRVVAPVVVGVGFTGGRVDHQLAALHGLLAFAHKPCVLLAETEVILIAPPLLSLPTNAGEVVSLFPLVPMTGRSDGLEWPIDGLHLAPGRTIGTSNRATGPLTIWADAPGLVMILPRRLLAAVATQLREGPRWPGPED